MKSVTKAILMLLLFQYVGFSYLELNLNPLEWPKTIRIGLVVFNGILTLGILLVCLIIGIEKETSKTQ